MHTLTRRQAIPVLAGGLAAAFAEAAPLGLPIGCQTYPVREALGKDFAGTLKELAAIGYRAIEMCSPPGYEKGGYGPLVGRSAADLSKAIHAAGLKCESCHYTFRELKENLDDRIAFAKNMGIRQMVLSTFGVRADAPMADWVTAAQELNRIAEKIAGAGLKTAFHNHNFEFKQIDGVLVYDKLMETLDAKLVGMQFQVSVISLGYDAADFMRKYPGRFPSLHLQDWNAAEKKQVAVGAGSVDWKKVFTAAKQGGVKNYFVELNMDALKASYPYLKTLKA
jgi:sugar phosphate isomerase/epimerase